MAHAMTYDLSNSGTDGAAGWLARAGKAVADYRLYRRTLDELRSLSDRELSDLGLSRLAIREVAHDSVYAA